MEQLKIGFVYKYSNHEVVLAYSQDDLVAYYDLTSTSEHVVMQEDFEQNSIEFNIDEALRLADPVKYTDLRRKYVRVLKEMGREN